MTLAFLVPPIVLALASTRSSTAPTSASLARSCRRRAARRAVAAACAERIGCVVQGYGLTETSPVAPPAARRPTAKPGSVGPPLTGTECRAVDIDTGEPLGRAPTARS